MNKVKILLGDPRHNTVGAHSNFVPINIGYIGKTQGVKDKSKPPAKKASMVSNQCSCLRSLANWFCWLVIGLLAGSVCMSAVRTPALVLLTAVNGNDFSVGG